MVHMIWYRASITTTIPLLCIFLSFGLESLNFLYIHPCTAREHANTNAKTQTQTHSLRSSSSVSVSMKFQLSHPLTHTLSPSLSNIRVRTKRSLLPLQLQTLTFFTHSSFLRLSPQNPNPVVAVEAVRFDGPVVEIGESSEVVDGDLAFETCITRTLPPALTLEHGLQSIKEAVDKLKLDPPSSASGVLRFQVTKTLNPLLIVCHYGNLIA